MKSLNRKNKQSHDNELRNHKWCLKLGRSDCLQHEMGRVDQRNVPAGVSEMSNTMDRAIDKLLLSFPTSALASSR